MVLLKEGSTVIMKFQLFSYYEKLENVIIPTFYKDRDNWTRIMRHSIGINESFFNTHREVLQYALNAYLE